MGEKREADQLFYAVCPRYPSRRNAELFSLEAHYWNVPTHLLSRLSGWLIYKEVCLHLWRCAAFRRIAGCPVGTTRALPLVEIPAQSLSP